ncbi:Crp/Fnr family transcriptional regulator [Desulfobaculum bizertense]|uniref:CRP/FNR family transcriptional regulator, anaerobic regulatory protein n=1 Tax=Desulfobaculum bizertense DSM 18034 TaxID=1121442 RepID=A0A1T4VCN6_9BACT|nr:Crp/Fnr family transcriptional regulator [Desulfobaculum bizertense]SKA62722.1 CRP/FNR family transcriptional regulator, anaerobic regulatory protein [Desulfobaculum bizertense DSM 18034]
MKHLWHLEGEDFFRPLAPELKVAFEEVSTSHQYKKNDTIFFEGDAGNSCFYVEKGLLRIFKVSQSGKEPSYFIRRTGELFGVAEVLESLPRKANAQALTPLILREISRSALEKLLEEYPQFSRRVITELGKRIRYLGDQVESLMTCDVTVRMARLLFYLAQDEIADESDLDRKITIPISLTQHQLAAMTGSCQQTVSDVLGRFQKQGLLRLSRKRIELLDLRALSTLSES